MQDNSELANKIINGEVGIIPTDTLYGLVASAKNQNSVSRLYSLKNRQNKPGTIIAANIDQLVDLGIKKRYLTAVEYYWPNSISVIIPVGNELNYLHQGLQTLAVRIPKDVKLLNLLEKSGALLTTSANKPNQNPARTIAEAKDYFGDEVDFYIDGGRLDGKPSTIIKVIDDAVEVLREGAVAINKETGRIEP